MFTPDPHSPNVYRWAVVHDHDMSIARVGMTLEQAQEFISTIPEAERSMLSIERSETTFFRLAPL